MGMFDFMKKKKEPVPSAPDIPGPDTKSVPPLDLPDAKMDAPPTPDGKQPTMSDIAAGLNLPGDAQSQPAPDTQGENIPGIWQQPSQNSWPQNPHPVNPPKVPPQMPKEPPQEIELPSDPIDPFSDSEHDLGFPDEPQKSAEVSPDPAEDEGPDFFQNTPDEPETEEIKPVEEIKHPDFTQPQFSEPEPKEEQLYTKPEPAQEQQPIEDKQTVSEEPPTKDEEQSSSTEEMSQDDLQNENLQGPQDISDKFSAPSKEYSDNLPLFHEEEPQEEVPEELDPFREDMPASKKFSGPVPSRKIINQALYINVEEFQNIAHILNGLGDDAKTAEDTLFRIKDIALGREKVFDKWQGDIESVERELIQLDKLLFNV